MTKTSFLNPKSHLVNAVTEWLAGHVRETAAGAQSLAHVTTIVPTRQSGRQLRLSLARAFTGRGVVPPHILLPSALANPADDSMPTATPSETAAALMLFLSSVDSSKWPTLFPHGFRKDGGDAPSAISLAEQLDEIWSALGASGLQMKDVLENAKAREVIESAVGNEIDRWGDLSSFETEFFAFLNSKGLRHHSQSLAIAKSSPAPLPEGVERIVLPGLVDPTPILFDILESHSKINPNLAIDILIHSDASDAAKFDPWGRPRIESWTGGNAPVIKLGDTDIIIANSANALAKKLASEDFPAPDDNLETPALGLVDSDLFPAIEAAFNDCGYGEIHNPERHILAASSLGRMVANILQLLTERPIKYRTISAFMRENDVLAALRPLHRTRILSELDRYQNAALPVDMPDDIDVKSVAKSTSEDAFAYPELREAYATIRQWLKAGKGDLAAAISSILQKIYATRIIGKEPGSREFAAAAEAVRDLLAEMDRPILAELDNTSRTAILRHALSKSSYQLEPETTDALKTEGWLELAWSPAVNIAVVGMTEGKVPDSIVGHAFLPDRLRIALELESNARRLARDSFLLSELVNSRSSTGRVKAYASTTNSSGEMQKPSRLLFLCEPSLLPNRVRRLLGEPDAPDSTPPRTFPSAWRLNCECEVPPLPDHFSASAIDTYISDPFDYYLKKVRGMEPYKEVDELAANDFGTLCHNTLSAYGNNPETKNLSKEDEIREALSDIFEKHVKAKYGPMPMANLLLQLQSAKDRLLSFATLQARQRAAGWEIVECERLIQDKKLFSEYNVTFKGYIDRIDRNAETGKYCIIDYKTWDSASKSKEKIFSTSGAEIAFAKCLGLPTFKTLEKKPNEARWLSVQMAIYHDLLSLDVPAAKGNIVECKYAILGESPQETAFFGGIDDNNLNIAAMLPKATETVKRAIELIAKGLFWPPSPASKWRYDFANLFLSNPETDFDGTDWVKSQRSILATVNADNKK